MSSIFAARGIKSVDGSGKRGVGCGHGKEGIKQKQRRDRAIHQTPALSAEGPAALPDVPGAREVPVGGEGAGGDVTMSAKGIRAFLHRLRLRAGLKL